MGPRMEDFEKKMIEHRIRKRQVEGEGAYNEGMEKLMNCSIRFQPEMLV